MSEITQWYTVSEYVDIDTGEQISKPQAGREYVIINKTKKTEIYGKTGTVKYINECKRNPQGRLFD